MQIREDQLNVRPRILRNKKENKVKEIKRIVPFKRKRNYDQLQSDIDPKNLPLTSFSTN